MSFDDVYNSMLLKRGGNVNNSDIRNSKGSINRKFKNDPSYKSAKLIKRDDINYEIDIDTRVINIDTNTKKKKIYFRPDTQVDVGDYIKYPDKVYLTLEFEDNLISPYAEATECNKLFKWMYKGVLYDAYGIGTNQTKYTLGTDSIQSGIIESDSRFSIEFPNNEVCKTIEVGQRFIFNDGAWKVTQVEYISSKDCIRSILLGQDSINENDDVENEIADFYQHKYTINLNEISKTLQETETYQIISTVYDNGKVINDIKVDYKSSDESIAIVDEKGLVTCIKSGNCDINVGVGSVSCILKLIVNTKTSANIINYGHTWSNGTNLKVYCSSTLSCVKNINSVVDNSLHIDYLFDTNGQNLINQGKIVVTRKSDSSISIKNVSVVSQTTIYLSVVDTATGTKILDNTPIVLINGL